VEVDNAEKDPYTSKCRMLLDSGVSEVREREAIIRDAVDLSRRVV